MIAAVYARKSTDQSAVADEAKSVHRQIDHARAYAARKGWTVDEGLIFVDDGISGAEFSKRPGFVRLMNALAPRPPFQMLVMSEESRLGRESIEVSYALKQIVTAGVRVFFYLEDRERTLDSPIEKAMLALQTMADEMEREKGRQRTHDALLRKARAGHVTGGRLFGYENVDITSGSGERSHVERRIVEPEAAIIRRIFTLSADGYGVKAIAKLLNADGYQSPRAQRDRSQTWAPSSVREVLYRDLYRGLITWNKTRKRDRWGMHRQAPRPACEWLEVPAPQLRIVDQDLWTRAHRRLEAVRGVYLRANHGQAFGRPALGGPSKYLLTNLALCGCCGGPLRARSRKGHGAERQHFYGCAAYHERGRTVCANREDVPMHEANYILIEALLDDVLDAELLSDVVDAAVEMKKGEQKADRVPGIEAEIRRVEQERARLVAAIASGGALDGLLGALKDRESRLLALEAERAEARAEHRTEAFDEATVRREASAIVQQWRRVLADDSENARPIVTTLLEGRVTITPTGRPKQWEMQGTGTLSGLFSLEIFPSGWRPHRDSNPGFSLERAAS